MASTPHFALTRRYSCMYTKDIVKKAKTWHDGYILFHHMNSKTYLLDDKFHEVDECFFRVPGLQSLSDVPKTLRLQENTQIDFDRHMATVDELVFEEEKDVSELWKKKRKDLDALDSLADQDVESSASRPFKRRSTNNRDERYESPAPPQRGKYNTPSMHMTRPLTNSTNNARPSPIPFRLNTPQMRPPPPPMASTSTSTSRTSSSSHSTTGHPGHTPKTTTPFKPPSFVQTAGRSGVASTMNTGTPSSVPRRMLGTTRPSSVVARRSLQLDWAKFSETAKEAQNQERSASTARKRESEDAKMARKAAMLEELSKQQEQEIVLVNQTRRDGEKGDTSSWMFD